MAGSVPLAPGHGAWTGSGFVEGCTASDGPDAGDDDRDVWTAFGADEEIRFAHMVRNDSFFDVELVATDPSVSFETELGLLEDPDDTSGTDDTVDRIRIPRGQEATLQYRGRWSTWTGEGIVGLDEIPVTARTLSVRRMTSRSRCTAPCC